MTRGAIFLLFLPIILLGWLLWPVSSLSFRSGDPAPEISGGPWINSEPLTISELRGRVVLVEFWTYG